MSATQQLLGLSWGQSVELQLVTYTVTEDPIVQSNKGRTGTKIEVVADCELICESADDLSSGLAELYDELSQDGRDLLITGLSGQPEYLFVSAVCTDGGPHCKFEASDHPSPFCKKLKLTVTGERTEQDKKNPTQPTNKDSYSVKTQTDAAGLKTVTRTGTISGVSTPATFFSVVLPQMQATYPLPSWSIDSSYEATTDANSSKVTYEAKAKQMAGTLPAASQATFAVDGTATQSVEIDEQQRRTTTYAFDLTIVGDAATLYAAIRPAKAKGIITRERMEIVTLDKSKLVASFTILDSAGHDALMNFSQTIKITGASGTSLARATEYEVRTYPGADPVVVQRPKGVVRVSQSGSATAAGSFFRAPSPLYLTFDAEPEVTYTHSNATEKQTSWNFSMIVVDSTQQPAANFDVRKPLFQLDRDQQDRTFIPILRKSS